MQAKILFEKAGGTPYSGDEKVSEENEALLKKVSDHLSQMGFGKKKPKKGKFDAVIDAIQSGTGLEEELVATYVRGVGKKQKTGKGQPESTLANPPGLNIGNGKKKSTNPWMSHLADFWKKNKGKMTYQQAMKKAKDSYK